MGHQDIPVEKVGEKVAAIKAISSEVVDGSLKIRVLSFFISFYGNKFRGIRSRIEEQLDQTNLERCLVLASQSHELLFFFDEMAVG